MSSTIALIQDQAIAHAKPGKDQRVALHCPPPVEFQRAEFLNADFCEELETAGCPFANPVHERLRFETWLAELSATFINLPSSEVDSQVESALRQLVDFLDVDRGGLAEVSSSNRQLLITHAYHRPGVPRLILNEQLPWYARTIQEGKVFRVSRLPEDLPPQASAERAYCAQVGLKSHIMIPLKVRDAVVGALGFCSFRAYREWPTDLVQRLRLIGEIFTNALQRKRAEAVVGESEDRFRLLAEAAPVMVWMSGPDKLCTYFNKHWLAFTGQPLAREMGNGWADGVHRDDLQRCLRTYEEAFDSRKPFRMEYRLKRFDGQYRRILDTGVPRFAADDTFEGYIGSCIDINDQKEVEEALSAREQSLRQTKKRLRQLAARLLHAQEEERRRIAREMHDDWTQRLALLGIDIAKLEKHLDSPLTALGLLHTMQEELISLSEDVHALSRQLHPSILDDLGLVEALRSECASFTRREGIAIAYQPQGVPQGVSKDAALCIYRVAQEALRNIAKHAAVREATVTLDATGQEVLLRITDKGTGFNPSELHSAPGLGLYSMEERVHLVGAKLSVLSACGEGTIIEVSIPQGRRSP